MDRGTQHSHLDLGLCKNLVLKRDNTLIYYIYMYHGEAYYNILYRRRTDRETDNRFVSATYIISHAAIVV